MNHVTMGDAKDEARRFLRLVSAFEMTLKKGDWPISGSKEVAAIKRCSLDLSRALTVMRKPS